VCELFNGYGYRCRGEESPLYKRDVDPTAKCPTFIHQVVAVESQSLGEDSFVEALSEGIDLEEN
jgi:hypothetical protein